MRSLQVLGRLTLLTVLTIVGISGLHLAAVVARAGNPEDAKADSNPPAASPESSAATRADADPKLSALRDRLGGVLRYYAKKKLNTDQHTAWEVMHMVIAQGVEAELHVGGPDGE